ncbi:MAG: hypothetical protein WCO33_03930 [bacterium]
MNNTPEGNKPQNQTEKRGISIPWTPLLFNAVQIYLAVDFAKIANDIPQTPSLNFDKFMPYLLPVLFAGGATLLHKITTKDIETNGETDFHKESLRDIMIVYAGSVVAITAAVLTK